MRQNEEKHHKNTTQKTEKMSTTNPTTKQGMNPGVHETGDEPRCSRNRGWTQVFTKQRMNPGVHETGDEPRCSRNRGWTKVFTKRDEPRCPRNRGWTQVFTKQGMNPCVHETGDEPRCSRRVISSCLFLTRHLFITELSYMLNESLIRFVVSNKNVFEIFCHLVTVN
jgi:hypothetical protein